MKFTSNSSVRNNIQLQQNFSQNYLQTNSLPAIVTYKFRDLPPFVTTSHRQWWNPSLRLFNSSWLRKAARKKKKEMSLRIVN